MRAVIPGELVCDYAKRTVADPKRIVLLLHGYSLSGEWTLRKLEKALPADARVIAPSAPYPIPFKKDRRYKIGYSWYFYDPYQDEYFIDMRVAVTYVESLLDRLDARGLPLTIVGYSQGGYLAPFVAERLARKQPVERIIGISSQFLEEEFPAPLLSGGKPIRMDAIHGETDDTVSCAVARKSHEKLRALGVPGEFHELPGAGHPIGPEILSALEGLF